MINLNLVPEKVRAGETLKLIVMLGSLSLVLPLIFWAWQFAGARAELAEVGGEIDKVVAELNAPHLRQVVEEVEQFSRDRSSLESKRALVDVLRKKQVVLVRMLDAIPDMIPKRAWLTKLEVKEDKGMRRVVLEGGAQAPEAVADFYGNLEANPVAKKPVMDAPPKFVPKGRGMEVIEFKMSFDLEETL